MAKARVEEEIAADASAVWELARDFGGLKRWNPGISSCEVSGAGVGAVRTIKMGDFALRERLEKIDEAKRSFSYAIIEAPIPVEAYLATFDVHALGPGKTRVVWSCTFEPKGAPEADLVALFEGVYRSGIAGLRNALG
jgi:carbon monoxide dehydrogenase subunit G